MVDDEFVLYFEGDFSKSTDNKEIDDLPFINLNNEDGTFKYKEAWITQCGEDSYIIDVIKNQLFDEGYHFLYSA